jgi:hypothetical protein
MILNLFYNPLDLKDKKSKGNDANKKINAVTENAKILSIALLCIEVKTKPQRGHRAFCPQTKAGILTPRAHSWHSNIFE